MYKELFEEIRRQLDDINYNVSEILKSESITDIHKRAKTIEALIKVIHYMIEEY